MNTATYALAIAVILLGLILLFIFWSLNALGMRISVLEQRYRDEKWDQINMVSEDDIKQTLKQNGP